MSVHEAPLSRMWAFVAHAIPWFVTVGVTVRLATMTLHISGWIDALTSIAVVVGFVALFLHLRTGALCLRCVQSAPLDPETEVRQKKMFLWQQHWSVKRFYAVWFAFLILTVIANSAPQPWTFLLDLPMNALFFSAMWAIWVHHRLGPWCPYCRGWDDGGPEELVPDPDPAETKRA